MTRMTRKMENALVDTDLHLVDADIAIGNLISKLSELLPSDDHELGNTAYDTIRELEKIRTSIDLARSEIPLE